MSTGIHRTRTRHHMQPAHRHVAAAHGGCLGDCCIRHPKRCRKNVEALNSPQNRREEAAASLSTRSSPALHYRSAFMPPSYPDNSTSFPHWVANARWSRQLNLATHTRAAKAGLMYVQIGAAWPPWIRFVIKSAAANDPTVAFYFLGPPLATLRVRIASPSRLMRARCTLTSGRFWALVRAA